MCIMDTLGQTNHKCPDYLIFRVSLRVPKGTFWGHYQVSRLAMPQVSHFQACVLTVSTVANESSNTELENRITSAILLKAV